MTEPKCVTHHHACECREAEFDALKRENALRASALTLISLIFYRMQRSQDLNAIQWANEIGQVLRDLNNTLKTPQGVDSTKPTPPEESESGT